MALASLPLSEASVLTRVGDKVRWLPQPIAPDLDLLRLQLAHSHDHVVRVTRSWTRVAELTQCDSTYYTFSALKWPFPRFLKQALTRLQITQFIVGGSLAASYLFIPLPTFAVAQGSISAVPSFGQLSHGSMKRAGEICLGEAAPRAAVWLNVLYLIFLTKLFVDFFIDSYRKTAAKKVD